MKDKSWFVFLCSCLSSDSESGHLDFLGPEAATPPPPPDGPYAHASKSTFSAFSHCPSLLYLWAWKPDNLLKTTAATEETQNLLQNRLCFSQEAQPPRKCESVCVRFLCDFWDELKEEAGCFSMCVYLKECADVWEFPNGSEFLGRGLLKKKINLHLYFSSVERQRWVFFFPAFHQINFSCHTDRKQQGYFSASWKQLCPLLPVGFFFFFNFGLRHWVYKKSLLAGANAYVFFFFWWWEAVERFQTKPSSLSSTPVQPEGRRRGRRVRRWGGQTWNLLELTQKVMKDLD